MLDKGISYSSAQVASNSLGLKLARFIAKTDPGGDQFGGEVRYRYDAPHSSFLVPFLPVLVLRGPNLTFYI